MSLKLIADESVDYRIVKKLRENKFDVISVHEKYRGMKDKKIIEITKAEDGILLTEDKDFGEWVFAHGVKLSVILLRYKIEEIFEIIKSLIKILKKYNTELKEKFIVITTKKIRIRNI